MLVIHAFLASSLSLSLSLYIYIYKYVCDRREDARVHMAAATVFEPVESVAVKTNINFAHVKTKTNAACVADAGAQQ